MSDWTLFSNHGHVLVCLARDSGARLRDVAAAVGITERAVQKIVRDLQEGGMLSVSKQGRRNQYRIHRKAGMRHSLESERNIGGLIDFVCGNDKPVAARKSQTVVKPAIQRVARNTEVEKKPVAAKKPKVDRKPETVPEKAAEAAKPDEKKKAPDKDKVDAKNEIEKQQGSLF